MLSFGIATMASARWVASTYAEWIVPAGITLGGEGRKILLCGGDSLLVPSGCLRSAVWRRPMAFFFFDGLYRKWDWIRCRLGACLLEEGVGCQLLCLQPVLCLLASSTKFLDNSFGFDLGENQVVFDIGAKVDFPLFQQANIVLGPPLRGDRGRRCGR